MKCYRSVQLEYGAPDKLFSGAGAVLNAGRWNEAGHRTIYCSSTASATSSERAYHSLAGPISMYNQMVKSAGRTMPAHYFDEITVRKFSLGEIEIINPNRLVDITSDIELEKHLRAAGLPSYRVNESRLDKYRSKRQFWTRQLSAYLSDQGHLGFIAKSARSEAGNTIVIFEENLDTADFKLHQIVELEISATTNNGKPFKKGMTADESNVLFKSLIDSGTASILYL